MKTFGIYSGPSMVGVLLGMASLGANAQDLPAELVRYPDSIYMNAVVVTVDNHEMNTDPGTIVEAIALRDGEIMALGSDEEIVQLAGPSTEITDLGGKMVLPGFIETHVHPQGHAEAYARELFGLRSTPEGYALSMDVAATADETMAKVAEAMDVLLAHAEPSPDEWINISLVHDPELGYNIPADVSTLMSARNMVDVRISKEDITEIVPNYNFVLSSATSILDAPKKGIWYHVTVGEHGETVYTEIVKFDWES